MKMICLLMAVLNSINGKVKVLQYLQHIYNKTVLTGDRIATPSLSNKRKMILT